MSMLIEKRNELVAKLDALEAARKAEIGSKVEAYRAALEAQTPKDEIDKVKSVLVALDEVIAYDVKVVSDVKIEKTVEEVVTAKPEAQTIESRPGMANVFAPSRE